VLTARCVVISRARRLGFRAGSLPKRKQGCDMPGGPDIGPAEIMADRDGQSGRARSTAQGRSAMKRTSIGRRRAQSGRSWPGALAPDPPDPDIAQAKAPTRTALSAKAAGT
jgi:hypothetical protein